MRSLLAVDDNELSARRLADFAQKAGFKTKVVSPEPEVLGREIMMRKPALVVLSGPDALDHLRALKESGEATPAVVALDPSDREALEEALRLGAEDYIFVPYREREVGHRLTKIARWFDETDRAKHVDQNLLSPTTPTGSPQELMISLEYEFMRASRYKHAFSCVAIRVENLRELAESLPEPALAMRIVDAGIRTCVRMIDHLFRTDAHEFAVILPETDGDGATTVVERIFEGAEDGSIWHGLTGVVSPAISVASATFPDLDVVSGQDLYEHARRALRDD